MIANRLTNRAPGRDCELEKLPRTGNLRDWFDRVFLQLRVNKVPNHIAPSKVLASLAGQARRIAHGILKDSPDPGNHPVQEQANDLIARMSYQNSPARAREELKRLQWDPSDPPE